MLWMELNSIVSPLIIAGWVIVILCCYFNFVIIL